mmetsp:Transcript_46350/g.97391  ORF Transcript_46350/g.97391 Transcript_46350/m.97391 type:complete len:86 (+) Transcript_46350:1521-1778(+)
MPWLMIMLSGSFRKMFGIGRRKTKRFLKRWYFVANSPAFQQKGSNSTNVNSVKAPTSCAFLLLRYARNLVIWQYHQRKYFFYYNH